MAHRRKPVEPVGLDRVLTDWTAKFLQQGDTTMEGPPYRILLKNPVPPAIYEFKVSLIGTKPLVWRRFWVPNQFSFAAFSDVLLEVMGWSNSHLHEFLIGKGRIGMVDIEDATPMLDEKAYRLCDVKKSVLSKMKYAYDFGDDWEHHLTLTKTLPPNTCKGPHCLEGARACPPEDCGGPWGYSELLQALSKHKHPRHKELSDWIGEGFDPDEFDLARINRKLSRLKNRK